MEKRSNIREKAVLKLIPYFQGKPRIVAWLLSYVDRCVELEDAIVDTANAFDLDTATGDQLRILADIVGVKDRPQNPEDLRVQVRARIRSNRSHGSPLDVFEVSKLMSPNSDIQVQEGLMYIAVLHDGVISFSPQVLAREIKRARAAGVVFELLHYGAGDSRGLRYSDAQTGAQPADVDGLGLENTDSPTTNTGKFWGVYK